MTVIGKRMGKVLEYMNVTQTIATICASLESSRNSGPMYSSSYSDCKSFFDFR